MTFAEAMKNPEIKSIRLPHWANKSDHLVLPPYFPEHKARGPWCKLKAWSPDGDEHDILAIEFKDDYRTDWEKYE